ncbi:hypothetical protein [uncultured Fibrobacter sp.]|uniref:hypothetical protein n=1 Tax=uncultured Fibrobacter sp. TaxID=261512 RepID=UPI002606D2EE|nr:hypothetical protein [uncultured Fibrobacter sp.]
MRRPEFLKTVLYVLLFAAMVFADADKVEHDNGRISIFLQPAISFLDFGERQYFQNTVDTIYREFYSQALTESESLTVAKQDFQKVNFCFPISGGLQFQPFRDNFLSLGLSFIYDHESVVLTDRKNKSHHYEYTIQGMPLFLEYRLAIPTNLMSLTGESLFSVAVRWYWVLPGTEIYSTWGKIAAETPLYGGGFGFSIGYLITSWKGFNVFGDIGYSSIPVKSKKSFADIVPDGPTENAKWNVGGLQLQIRVAFSLWDYPKIEQDSTANDSSKVKRSDSTKTLKGTDVKANKPTAKTADSTAAPADTTKKATTDSTKAADTTKTAADTVKVDTTGKITDTTAVTDTTKKASIDTEPPATTPSAPSEPKNEPQKELKKEPKKQEEKATETPTKNAGP